jgi:hypothetical protein
MKKTLLIFFIVFVVAQFIRIDKTNELTDKNLEIVAPTKVMSVLKKACYDCHSNEVKWPWYSNVAPISWVVADHVIEGRKALNFSIWQNYSNEEKKKRLKEIFRTVYASMPLASYVMFHKEADLTKDERTMVRDWTGVKK